MKRNILLAIVFACVFPSVLVGIFWNYDQNTVTIPNEEIAIEQTTGEVTQEEKLTIKVWDGNQNKEMELEEYITGVVLAEMPAGFHEEALKAQAVVARTYTARKLVLPKHEDASVCMDSACCQAYCSIDDYLTAGGSEADVAKIRQAVTATENMVLLYMGELIEATYFSCSGGRTEDAVAVWGSDVPYLQSVDSPGEEKATHYMDTVTFSLSSFCEKLGIHDPIGTESLIGQITYTQGGGVKTIMINGAEFTGVTLRQKLGLRSTAFVITAIGNTVTVTTKGFGHRVGMSQYGADAMALSGSSWNEILEHYYQGAQAGQLSVDNLS